MRGGLGGMVASNDAGDSEKIALLDDASRRLERMGLVLTNAAGQLVITEAGMAIGRLLAEFYAAFGEDALPQVRDAGLGLLALLASHEPPQAGGGIGY